MCLQLFFKQFRLHVAKEQVLRFKTLLHYYQSHNDINEQVHTVIQSQYPKLRKYSVIQLPYPYHDENDISMENKHKEKKKLKPLVQYHELKKKIQRLKKKYQYYYNHFNTFSDG